MSFQARSSVSRSSATGLRAPYRACETSEARSSSGTRAAACPWTPQCGHVIFSAACAASNTTRGTHNRSVTRRNASVDRAVSWAGNETNVPSRRNPPAVTSRRGRRSQLAREPNDACCRQAFSQARCACVMLDRPMQTPRVRMTNSPKRRNAQSCLVPDRGCTVAVVRASARLSANSTDARCPSVVRLSGSVASPIRFGRRHPSVPGRHIESAPTVHERLCAGPIFRRFERCAGRHVVKDSRSAGRARRRFRGQRGPTLALQAGRGERVSCPTTRAKRAPLEMIDVTRAHEATGGVQARSR